MKKAVTIFFLFILFLSLQNTFAQKRIQIAGFAGYQMLGGVAIYSGDADINDSEVFGGAFAYFIRPDVAIEFQYSYQPTKLSYDPYGGSGEYELFDLDVHYFLIGGSYHKPLSPTVTGFGGISAGMASFVPGMDYDSAEKFAFAATLGLKVQVSKTVGLRFQAQGLFPIQWASGGFFIGTGGADFGVSAGTTIVQIALQGGLYVTL